MSVPKTASNGRLSYAPDTLLIRQSLLDAEEALGRVRNDKATLVELRKKVVEDIRQAVEQEKKLTQLVAQYRKTFASFAQFSLDDKILRHVFMQLARSYGPVLFPRPARKGIPPQLVFSHVCSRWRRIVLSMPELWNNTGIRCETLQSRNFQSHQRWLLRAGNHPVTLKINSQKVGKDDTHMNAVQQIIMPFRVKTLHLELSLPQLSALDRLPEAALSDLENLQISFTSLCRDPSLRDLPQFVTKTRSIAFQELEDIEPAFLLHPEVALPWGQLRCLESRFGLMTIGTAAKLLRLTPILEDLVIYVRWGIGDKPGVERLSLPHLRDLTLVIKGEKYIDDVLESFEFPNLSRLKISSRIAWTVDTYDIIKRQYNLHELEEVIFCDGYPLPLSTILKDVPKLHELWLPEKAIVDDEAITGIATGELERRLKVLCICCICDIGEILGMVEQRRRTVARIVQKGNSSWKDQIWLLREVVLEKAEAEEKYAKRIGALKKAGIKVAFQKQK